MEQYSVYGVPYLTFYSRSTIIYRVRYAASGINNAIATPSRYRRVARDDARRCPTASAALSLDSAPVLVLQRLGSGKGSIYEYPKGNNRWYSVIYVDGKPIKRSSKSPKEAAAVLKQLIAERDQQIDLHQANVTLDAYWAKWLAQGIAEERLRSKTSKDYQGLYKNLIQPHLGSMQLRKITTEHINRMIAKLKGDGKAPDTLRAVRRRLKSVFRHAVTCRVITSDPTAHIKDTSGSSREMEPLSDDHVKRLLTAVRGHQYEFFYVLAVSRGLRESEIIGLRWKHINLERGYIRLTSQAGTRINGRAENRPTKTLHSRRFIPIDDQLIALLQQQQQRIAAHRDQEQRQAAKQSRPTRWVENNLVLPSLTGGYLSARNIQRHYDRVLEQTGITAERAADDIPNPRLHDLRHTAATMMLSQRVPLHVVSRVLGHTSIKTTADLYGHLCPDDLADNMRSHDLFFAEMFEHVDMTTDAIADMDDDAPMTDDAIEGQERTI